MKQHHHRIISFVLSITLIIIILGLSSSPEVEALRPLKSWDSFTTLNLHQAYSGPSRRGIGHQYVDGLPEHWSFFTRSVISSCEEAFWFFLFFLFVAMCGTDLNCLHILLVHTSLCIHPWCFLNTTENEGIKCITTWLNILCMPSLSILQRWTMKPYMTHALSRSCILELDAVPVKNK